MAWRDRLKAVSALQKSGDLDAALTEAENAVLQFPSSLPLLAKRLQLLLKARHLDEASTLALHWREWGSLDERTAKLVLLSLSRGGMTDEISAFCDAHLPLPVGDPGLVCTLMDALAVADPSRAIAIAEDHRRLVGGVTAEVSSRLAELHAVVGDIDSSNASALLAIEKDPRNLKANVRLARNLLAAGSPKTAADYLEVAVQEAPHLAKVRVDAARALKLAGDPDRAAEHLLELGDEDIFRNRANERLLISTLLQAGRVEEADQRYLRMVSRQRDQQAATLAEALGRPPEPMCGLDARMTWAKAIIGAPDVANGNLEREAALWGYHADTTILDWLETREDAVTELMELFVDLTPVEETLRSAIGEGAALVVSAHIGALYAGPVALELLGVEATWLASSPNPPSAYYGKQLISTADNDRVSVGYGVRSALETGQTVVIALDGSANPAAPRVSFEGRSVTYSDFAAMLSARMGLPAVFASPVWTEDRRIDFYLSPMPTFVRGTRLQDHLEAWRNAYFVNVRKVLATRPENWRLSGGIWRDVA